MLDVGLLALGPVERLLDVLDGLVEGVILYALAGTKVLSLAVHKEVAVEEGLKARVLGCD